MQEIVCVKTRVHVFGLHDLISTVTQKGPQEPMCWRNGIVRISKVSLYLHYRCTSFHLMKIAVNLWEETDSQKSIQWISHYLLKSCVA